jgi:hypothetical protein
VAECFKTSSHLQFVKTLFEPDRLIALDGQGVEWGRILSMGGFGNSADSVGRRAMQATEALFQADRRQRSTALTRMIIHLGCAFLVGLAVIAAIVLGARWVRRGFEPASK